MSLLYREHGANTATGRALFRDRLRDAMLRHPGESFFPLLGSLVAYRAQDGRVLLWIGRALELAPTNGPVHFVLAQFLGAHKATSQAMLHLRLAVEYDHTLSEAAATRAAQWAPSLEVLQEAIPDGRAGDGMFALACSKTQAELKPECFRRAIARSPREPALRTHLADSLLVALRFSRPPCAGTAAEGCMQEIDRTARALAKLDPRSWRAGYLVAKVLRARGDTKGAAMLLANVCPTGAEGRACAREAVAAAIQSRSDEVIVAAADRYMARTCESSASCAEDLDWVGSALQTAGKLALAIKYYSKAAELDGSTARWLRVADLSAQSGLVGVARLALERADHSPDVSENSRAHTELLRRRLARDIATGPL